MMDEGGVEVDGKSDEAMLKVICETDAGGMNHVIRVVPSDVLSSEGDLGRSTHQGSLPQCHTRQADTVHEMQGNTTRVH